MSTWILKTKIIYIVNRAFYVQNKVLCRYELLYIFLYLYLLKSHYREKWTFSKTIQKRIGSITYSESHFLRCQIKTFAERMFFCKCNVISVIMFDRSAFGSNRRVPKNYTLKGSDLKKNIELFNFTIAISLLN